MCKYCELTEDGDYETRTDPELEGTRAYLEAFGAFYTLTISAFGNVCETTVDHCPWCGRDLWE